MASSTIAPGLLVVDKPHGPTSHDIVAQARRIYRTRKVGHAGTLDPAATGVLLLLIGEASKLCAYLTGEDKRYLAEISFGLSTDTLDAEGSPVASVELADGWLDPVALAEVLDQERNRRAQVPPIYSAIKSGGIVAHRAARRGVELVLPQRDVSVSTIAVLDRSDRTITLELNVSKGYYVRALARDIGESLRVPAHLSSLRRLSSGKFTIDEAVAWPPEASSPPPLLPVDEVARRCLAVAQLTPEGASRARVGKALTRDDFTTLPTPLPQAAAFAWEFEHRLVAIGRQADGEFRVSRGFTHQGGEWVNGAPRDSKQEPPPKAP